MFTIGVNKVSFFLFIIFQHICWGHVKYIIFFKRFHFIILLLHKDTFWTYNKRLYSMQSPPCGCCLILQTYFFFYSLRSFLMLLSFALSQSLSFIYFSLNRYQTQFNEEKEIKDYQISFVFFCVIFIFL